jgi:hypothetical protein
MSLYNGVGNTVPVYLFDTEFSSTWRLTPDSLDIVNDVIHTHPEVPFLVRILIQSIGIPDIQIKTSADCKELLIQSGIGPIKRSQTLRAGSILWKGLFNTYPMKVQMAPGTSRSFKVSGSIPKRGFCEFMYTLSDDGNNLSVDASVPMKEGDDPYKISILLYSVEKSGVLQSKTQNRRILIIPREH